MATPKGLMRLAGDELLADGEWHDREEVLRAMAAAVPPGRAIRERRREAQRRLRDGRVVQPLANLGEEVVIGARALAGRCMGNAISDRKWERDGDRVRLRPQ